MRLIRIISEQDMPQQKRLYSTTSPLVGGTLPEDYIPFELEATCFVWTNNPNTIIDTTSFQERKFEAIAHHKSQFTEEELLKMKAYLTHRGRSDASEKNFEIGEPLKIVPPQFLHCFPEAKDY